MSEVRARCKRCGAQVSGAWVATDEFVESGYCGACLHGQEQGGGGE